MKIDEMRSKKPNRINNRRPDPAIAAIEESIRCANSNLNWMENHGRAPIEKPNYLYSYNDFWSQGCYVLRYMYAYAYEYISLYSQIITEHELPKTVKVLSLGCGNMVDAWSLQKAAKRHGLNIEVFYNGVDVVRWNKEYEPKTDDNIHKTMIVRKAGDYMSEQSALDFNILIFPKSIGDIGKDRNDFNKLVAALEKIQITEERFIIVFSFVNHKDGSQSDSVFSDKIISCLTRNGFNYVKTSYVESNGSISSKDYPPVDPYLWNQTERLTGKNPISWRSYEKYYIYEFTKGAY